MVILYFFKDLIIGCYSLNISRLCAMVGCYGWIVGVNCVVEGCRGGFLGAVRIEVVFFLFEVNTQIAINIRCEGKNILSFFLVV